MSPPAGVSREDTAPGAQEATAALHTHQRAREGEEPAAGGANAAAGGPAVSKRALASAAGAPKVKLACVHCNTQISCAVRPTGSVHKYAMRIHEQKCPENPARAVASFRGLKVGDVFGALGGDSEFRAPEYVRELGQGTGKRLEGAIHVFSDGSSHPVIGRKTKEPICAAQFFRRGVRCCAPEDESMMRFRMRPELFPKLYAGGRCVIAEIGAEQIEGAPPPWKTSDLRLFSLNFRGTIALFDTRCGEAIEMDITSCAQGRGPCRNCTGNHPETVLFERSFQCYLDKTGRAWSTTPDARTFLACRNAAVHFTCNVCADTWARSPHVQVQCNLGCPGCAPTHLAELCAYELYRFVFPDAEMYARGQARIEGVHANPYDVASDKRIIVEVMSFNYHVEAGKLPNDVEKMVAALRASHVFIVAHCEDRAKRPELESAWKRCMVHALRRAEANATPRLIHVRCDASWTAYDAMRDAALAAGFAYEDIFCGGMTACATEKLPGETMQQTTLSLQQ